MRKTMMKVVLALGLAGCSPDGCNKTSMPTDAPAPDLGAQVADASTVKAAEVPEEVGGQCEPVVVTGENGPVCQNPIFDMSTGQ